MMDRVSDPQLSPDGKRVAYQLRETDYAANKGVNSIWVLDLSEKQGRAERVDRQRLSTRTVRAGRPTARACTSWPRAATRCRCGKSAADRKAAAAAGHAALPLDVNNYKLSPDGKQRPAVARCVRRLRRSWPARKSAWTKKPRTRPAARCTTSCSSATGTPGPTAGVRSCSSPHSMRTARSAPSRRC